MCTVCTSLGGYNNTPDRKLVFQYIWYHDFFVVLK